MTHFSRILIAFSFAILIGLTACKEEKQTIKPQRTQLTEAVYASVTVEPEDRYDAYANVQGILHHLAVQDGDTVQKGDLIAHIKNPTVESNVENAELSYRLAQEQLDGRKSKIKELEIQIESAQKQLEVDSSLYFRQKSLWDKEIGSRVELDQKRLKFELSKKSLKSLKQRVEQMRNELENQVQRSLNNLQSAMAGQDDFYVRSKMDGRVYQVFKEEGELVSPQQSIATIGKVKTFILEMQIDEVDIVRVQNDQTIIVSLDAYGEESFEGRVSKIYPTKDDRTQTFTVEGRFVDPPGQLYAGLSGEANIVISNKQDVMTIPLEYVIDGKKVMTTEGEKDVALGSRDLEKVEVISGLDPNDELIKP